MSLKSVQDKVKRNVIQPDIPTCYPVAVEIISKYDIFPDRLYKRYATIAKKIDAGATAEEAEQLYYKFSDSMARHLGFYGIDSVMFEQAKSARKLGRLLTEMGGNGWRLAIDVVTNDAMRHSLGVVPCKEEGLFALKGLVVPTQLRGPVSAKRIAEFLYIDDTFSLEKFPMNASNIVAFPPSNMREKVA